MYQLYIANKNYSSWSLRPWALMRTLNIPFEERFERFVPGGSWSAFRSFSPTGKVPTLVDGRTIVWDSLAICEYLADKFPGLNLWPQAADARAIARSVCAEMHSGFAALRTHMSMNCRARFPGKGRTPEVLADIARITTIWNDCRARFGGNGPFLFGEFTIADAMYAPVVLRFETFAVVLDIAARAYADAVLALPALREWVTAGSAETERLLQFEPYATDV